MEGFSRFGQHVHVFWNHPTPLPAAKLASSDSAMRALQRDLEAARYSATQMKQELEEVGEGDKVLVTGGNSSGRWCGWVDG